jgi:hypothetical protein
MGAACVQVTASASADVPARGLGRRGARGWASGGGFCFEAMWAGGRGRSGAPVGPTNRATAWAASCAPGRNVGAVGKMRRAAPHPMTGGPCGWAAAAEGRARPRAVGGRRPSAAAGRGEQSGWASNCADGWASTHVAQPGKHGGDAKWWLGARARAEAGVRELRAYWAARCGCAGGLRGGGSAAGPLALLGRGGRWPAAAEQARRGGGGRSRAERAGRENLGWFTFYLFFLKFEFMNALQNTSIIQKKMYTSA